jgi:hypothetical protein
MNNNVCGICQEGGDLITLHKSSQWKHEFHKSCIDQWTKECAKKSRQPCCPICMNFIIKLPLVDGAKEAKYRWRNICYQMNSTFCECDGIPQTKSLYMGIMVSMRGRPILKLLQTDCDIDCRWNLGQIKEYIKGLNMQVYHAKGAFDSDNLTHNTTLSNWTRWKYPVLRVVDAYYGTPQLDRMEDVHIPDETSVKDMYIEYQTRISEYDHANFTDICHRKDYDLYGERDLRSASIFWNDANPPIPLEYRAIEDCEKSTINSLAWLVVDVAYA